MPTVYSSKDNSAIDLGSLPGIVVLVTVPAAFSGTCTSACIPSILENLSAIKEAGAARIIVVSTDQPHAMNEWIRIAKWKNEDIEFASDFDQFEVRQMIGKLGEEKGKEKLPPPLAGLLRRSYSVLHDGKIVWQFIEPDTTKYTLQPEELIAAVKGAKGR
jgi:peroxiredoxin